jgi:hypothetical protein
VERLLQSSQAGVVAAAAAHDFNDELTVILSSVSRSILALEPGHPARPYLFDLQGAALRCAYRAARLLEFSAGGGALS